MCISACNRKTEFRKKNNRRARKDSLHLIGLRERSGAVTVCVALLLGIADREQEHDCFVQRTRSSAKAPCAFLHDRNCLNRSQSMSRLTVYEDRTMVGILLFLHYQHVGVVFSFAYKLLIVTSKTSFTFSDAKNPSTHMA